MARQKGFITLEGTLSGINFYYRKGVPVSRRAGGGFTAQAIKSSPSMVRVRENASEFGLVSKAKKLVRLGLYPFLKTIPDDCLHGRMMTLFQQIKVLDGTSARGQRRFENGLATAEGRQLMQDFAITPQKATTLLPGAGHFDPVAQVYTLTDINLKALRLPKGASGMQLCVGILQADFAAHTATFYPSDPFYITAAFSDSMVALAPSSLPENTGVRLAVLQVRYYQEVNGSRFLFHEQAAQALEVVGVY